MGFLNGMDHFKNYAGLKTRAALNAVISVAALILSGLLCYMFLSRGWVTLTICMFVILGGLVVYANFMFIHSITAPIWELTELAHRISDGGYGLQAVKCGEDEIGELTDAINEMSVKICEAEKVQSEFISSVSHELRTPLTAITGWSETMLFDENITGDSRRGLEIIGREAGRLTNMVSDLLEFTRIQDGRFKLTMELVDITAELEDAIMAYSDLLKKEHMKLIFEIPEGEVPLINGDPERLRQVFLNILDNAAKYGTSGETIEVKLRCNTDTVSISFRDHGPGIPENELSHVKEKFYKGSSHVRGNGIGLAVCEEIITRHGGELTIANAPGGGCCVTVKLPLGESQMVEPR